MTQQNKIILNHKFISYKAKDQNDSLDFQEECVEKDASGDSISKSRFTHEKSDQNEEFKGKEEETKETFDVNL